MSDGNFNRSMLPSNSYQSGVRAGRSQMRIKAIQLVDEEDNRFFEFFCIHIKGAWIYRIPCHWLY